MHSQTTGIQQTTQRTGKLITVFGCTGAQGGSVLNALLPAGYTVRGVTRHPEKWTSLRDRGIELVQCDMVTDNLDKITNILRGSYGCYLMTNYWDNATKGREFEIGRKLVDAARKAGVKHLIWSTLPNVEKMSQGKYKVQHFTDKGKVEEYIRELQSREHPFETVTFAAPAFYYQNFRNMFPPKKEGETWVFTFPETRYLTACDVNEVGPAICHAFNKPKEFDGVRIDYWGDHGDLKHYVEGFSKATGKKAKLNMVPRDQWENKEIAEMFAWFDEFTLFGPGSNPDIARKATPGGLCTWEQHLEKHGWDFTAA